jgi:hypothetical protein
MKFTSYSDKALQEAYDLACSLWNLTPHDISEWDIDSEDELMNSIDDQDESEFLIC